MLKIVKIHILTVFATVMAFTFVSCNERLFDYEGDCEVHHIVRFRYERNLKWADAFPAEVKSVNLYVFDNNGVFVQEYSGKGSALSNGDYGIELKNLPVGTYKFVAWCGLDNGKAEESFTVPQPVAGQTTIDELTCSLNSVRITRSGEYSSKRLDFMYHGYMEATLVDKNDGQTFEYVMDLTKDTNHIRVLLQELSSDEDMNPDDYEIIIECANGVLAYDNSIISSEVVTYKPWAIDNDIVSIGKTDVSKPTFVKGLYADLSLSRLMASQRNSLYLTISHDNTVVVRVPLIQYALMSRKYYEEAYGHLMTDQEFLDREDEFVFTFFLFGNRWLDSYIDIYSWRIVLHDYDVDSGM